jgi:hypothetical protein
MIVNSVTPYSVTKGNSSKNKADIAPQYASVAFTGSEHPHKAPSKFSWRGLGRVLTLVGITSAPAALLTACPAQGPGGDEPPASVTSTGTGTGVTTATNTAVGTSTATGTNTATTPNTAVTKLNAALENAGIAIADPDQPPKVISYVDSFNGDQTTMTLDPTKTKDNTVVYKSVTNVTDTGVITYNYDPTTNALTHTSVGDLDGVTRIAKITMDADGYTVFTNAKTGKIDSKWRKIGTGQIGIYDQAGNFCRTYDNFTITTLDGNSYLAKLGKDTKAPIVRFTEGVLPKVKKVAQEIKTQKLARYV